MDNGDIGGFGALLASIIAAGAWLKPCTRRRRRCRRACCGRARMPTRSPILDAAQGKGAPHQFNSAEQVLGEAAREGRFSQHVENPQEAKQLMYPGSITLAELREKRAALLAGIRETVTSANGKTYQRRLRADAATLYTEIHSHPMADVFAVVIGDGGEAVEGTCGIAEESVEGRLGAGGGLFDDAVSAGQDMAAVPGFKDQHGAAIQCLGRIAGEARAQAPGVDRTGAGSVKQVSDADIDMLAVLRHPAGLALLQIRNWTS